MTKSYDHAEGQQVYQAMDGSLVYDQIGKSEGSGSCRDRQDEL